MNDETIFDTIARPRTAALLAIAALGLAPSAAWSQWDEGVLKITASVPVAHDEFGCSIDVSGGFAIVGAPFHDENGANSGAAYVRNASNAEWGEDQMLLASDGAAEDRFGFAVGMSGDVAVVGAYMDDDMGTDAGSAYVFRRIGGMWVQEQKLLASDGAAGDAFGRGVAIDGNVIAIGATGDDGPASGAAYVYRYNGTSWLQETKLLPPENAANFFGNAVAVSGDVVVIGNALALNSGAVYVYRYNGVGWPQEQMLVPTDGAQGDLFGISVAVDGDVIAVGANADDDNGLQSGSAYVFRSDNGGWTQQAKLTASDGQQTDHYGNAIAVSGDTVVVGASEHDGGQYNLYNTGAAYVYRNSGSAWPEEAKLEAPDGWQMDFFGFAVAIDGPTIISGANEDDYMVMNSGSAYVFHDASTAAPCTADLDGTSDVGFADVLMLLSVWGNCPGCAADLDGSGDVGFNDLFLLLEAWGSCP